jgi:hypothetical protein
MKVTLPSGVVAEGTPQEISEWMDPRATIPVRPGDSYSVLIPARPPPSGEFAVEWAPKPGRVRVPPAAKKSKKERVSHRWHHCDLCSKKFVSAQALSLHKTRAHVGRKKSESAPPKAAEAGSNRPSGPPRGALVAAGKGADASRPAPDEYLCGECGKGFPTRSLLNLHRNEGHVEKGIDPPTGPAPVALPREAPRSAPGQKLTLERIVEGARAWVEERPGGAKEYARANGLNQDLLSTIVTHYIGAMGFHRGRGAYVAPEVRTAWDELTPERRLELAQEALGRRRPGSGTPPSGATSTGRKS